MRRHMTDEGWQLFAGLHEGAGWELAGKDIGSGYTDARDIANAYAPGTVLVQDKREWLGLTADRSRDPSMAFTGITALQEMTDVFRGTVLKDAQSDGALHQSAAIELGAHFWVCYYAPRIVAHLAPYVRPQHLVRTYHSLDSYNVPSFSVNRSGTILSGASSGAYPLRRKIAGWRLPTVTVLPHPGYHRRGCATPEYLKTLARHRVSICTCSVYGYALRKIIESTAMGCIVVTNLPRDEVLPEIDDNLVRIENDISPQQLATLVTDLEASWDTERQWRHAKVAQQYYDYRAVGKRLSDDIETLRRGYTC